MPVNLNLLSDDVIARGITPPDVSKGFDSYFAGADQAQKQQLQNLFANGLPRDAQGNVDWGKAAEMALQAQGAPGLASAAAASKFGLLQNYFKNAPEVPENPGLTVPDRRSENMPPSLARPSLAMVEEPTGTPGPPNMNLTSGQITGIQRGPIEGNPLAFAQPERPAGFDERFTGDSAELPGAAKVTQFQGDQSGTRTIPLGGVDASGRPLPPTGTYTTRPAAPSDPTGDVGGVPSAPTSSGGLVISEENARRFEAAAAAVTRRAEALGALDPAMGAAERQRAASYAATAKSIRDQLLDQAKLTDKEKLGRGAGLPTLEYDRREKYGQLDAAAFNDEMKAINSAATNAATNAPLAALGKQLTQQSGFYSGPLNEYNTGFQQFRNLFGSPGAALPAEAFDKVANTLLQDQIKSMGSSGVGRVLQSEVAIMRRAIASMGITDVSNRALLEMVQRSYAKAQAIAELTRNMPPNSRQLNAAILGYLRANPMFTKEELANPRLLGSKEPPPEFGTWSKAQQQQWGAQNGLQPGNPIMFNGKLSRIPLQAQ